MEMQAPKGTKDMLPQDAYKWHFVEKTFRDVAKYYGEKLELLCLNTLNCLQEVLEILLI